VEYDTRLMARRDHPEEITAGGKRSATTGQTTRTPHPEGITAISRW